MRQPAPAAGGTGEVRPARRRRLLGAAAGWLAAGGLGQVAVRAWAAPAASVPALGHSGPALELAEASAWLQRIRSAGTTISYQGTVMSTAGGVTSSARVIHHCTGRDTYELVELLDGQSRQQYRHNDRVLTVWPATRQALFETRDPVAQFPALPTPSARVLELYDAHRLPADRVAGLDADGLLLKPRDVLRFGQRLWVHRDSGLLLRAEVLGPGGEVLESTTFVDLKLGAKLQPEQVLKPMRNRSQWTVAEPQVERTQLETEGWALEKPPTGFQLVSCTRRPLSREAEPAGAARVLQVVFSDGLAQVSLFIERHAGQPETRLGSSSVGASHTLVSVRKDWSVTLVGEVPALTLRRFDAQLVRRA